MASEVVTPSPVSAPSAGSRALRWTVFVIVALVALVLLAVVAIRLYDWNHAKPWINEKVSTAIGRPFAVQGDLSVDWRWPQPLEEGWRRWIPGPRVQAQDVSIGNPPEFPAKGPYLARIGAANADIALWPLLARQIDIRSVALSEPDVKMERIDANRNNWTIRLSETSADQAHKRWDVKLGRLAVDKGRVAYDDKPMDLAVQGVLNTLPADATEQGRYGVGFDFSGRHGKGKAQGSGKAGALLSLREEQFDFPLKFDARAGSVSAQAEGHIANPRHLSGLDFRVTLAANSMADLYPLTGIVLPDTPPFKTNGHLIGTLEPKRAVWRYEKFTGTVGQSDLRGDLTFTSGEPRPRLQGNMASRTLRLADLGTVVGKDSKTPERRQRPGKVLPDDPFDTARWGAMDLDITYAGERIIRPEAVPIDSLRTHAVLENRVLKLSPLDFGVAEGRFKTHVTLDSNAKPLKASLRGDVQGLKLSALFPKIELMKKSLGRMDGGVRLDGRGQSMSQLLASADGQATLYVRNGVLSQQLLDLAGLNLGSLIVSKLFGTDREVKLRCAIADVPVQKGVAYARNVKLNTDDALIDVTGTADMAREHFDLDVNPQAYEMKFFSLRTPLEVRGPFANPHVGVKPGPLILRAAAAVAAATAAPAALALLPITVPGADDDAGCAMLRKPATRPDAQALAAPNGAAAAGNAKPRAAPASSPMPAAGEFSGGQQR